MLDDYRWYLPGYQQAASVRIGWFWMTFLVKWGGVALRSESWNRIAEPIIIDNRVRTYFIIYGIIIMWWRRQSSTRFSTMANEVFSRENWGSVYPQAGYCCTKTRSKYCNSCCLSGPWIRQAYCRASWAVSQFVCGWDVLVVLPTGGGKSMFRDLSTCVWQSPKERRTIAGHLCVRGSSR